MGGSCKCPYPFRPLGKASNEPSKVSLWPQATPGKFWGRPPSHGTVISCSYLLRAAAAMPAACDSWKPGPWRPMWLRVAALPKCPRQHRRLRRSAGVFCPNQGLTHLLLGLAASYERVMPGTQPCARMCTSARDPQNRPLSGCTSAPIQPQTARARESTQPPLTRQGAHPMGSLQPRVWPGIMPCSVRAPWNPAGHAALVLPVGGQVCLTAH